MRLIRKVPAFVLAFTLVVSVPATAAATDWTQFRSDPAQSGANTAETTLTPTTVGGLQKSWTQSIPSEIIWAAPLVLGDETIISAYPSTVAAFATSTGESLWTFEAPSGQLPNPIAASAGTVYVASDGGPLYALDATSGEVLWQRALGGSYYGGPTAAQDVVYVPGGGRVYALDASTGATLWSKGGGEGFNNVSTPAVSGGFVVVGTLDGLHAFRQVSGAAVWTYPFARAIGIGASIAGNAVFAAAGRTEVKLDLATGQVIWRKTLQSGNTANSSPAVGDGLVVLHIERADDPRGEVVTARSALTGNVVWSVAYPHGDTFSIDSSPAIAGGVVYVGFSNQRVRAFDATTGTLLWKAVLDAASFSSPSIANGQLEIGTLAGTLYAFRRP